jgi:hypothetical protein
LHKFIGARRWNVLSGRWFESLWLLSSPVGNRARRGPAPSACPEAGPLRFRSHQRGQRRPSAAKWQPHCCHAACISGAQSWRL